MTAFEKYLVSLNHSAAAGHLLDCLLNGKDNAAWELVHKYYGRDFRFEPQELIQSVQIVIEKLKQESKESEL